MRIYVTILSLLALAGGGYFMYNKYYKYVISISRVDWIAKTVEYRMAYGVTKSEGIVRPGDNKKVAGRNITLEVQTVLGNLVFTIRKNGKEIERKTVDFDKQVVS